MAKVCYFTGRKTSTGNNRSHAMNASKRTVKPNLQKVRVMIDGTPKKVWVSARALKSGKIELLARGCRSGRSCGHCWSWYGIRSGEFRTCQW